MLSQWQQIKEQTFIIHHTVKRYIIVYVQYIMVYTYCLISRVVAQTYRGRACEYGERSLVHGVLKLSK